MRAAVRVRSRSFLVMAQTSPAGNGAQTGTADRAPQHQSRFSARRAAALLEVVVSVSILLLAMAVVGGVFRNGQLNIERAEQMTRGQVLTERLLVEMDTGLLDMKEREQTGSFGEESIEGMSWRVELTPHEKIDKLLNVDVSIYLGDPSGAEEARKLVMTTRVLRPEPRGLDLEEDAGLDEEQIAQITELIPGGEAMFDPLDFDPRILAQLPLDQLADLLPSLIQAFGINLSGAQMSGIIQALQQGDMSALQGAAQQGGGQLDGGAGLVPGAGGAAPGGGAGRRGATGQTGGQGGGRGAPGESGQNPPGNEEQPRGGARPGGAGRTGGGRS